MSRGLLQLSGIVVDLVHRIDALPRAGDEVEARDFMITPGGGFNAMVAAKRLGAAVTYGGTLGTGPFSEMAARTLSGMQIPIAARNRAENDQGSCVVIVDANGERSFISHHGAERRIDRMHLDGLGAAGYAYALLSGYSLYKPESAAAFVPWLAALSRPPQLLFDPGPVVADIPPAALALAMARADWVSVNAREAQVLTGESNSANAAATLGAGRSGALVRIGAGGCWLATSDGVRHVVGFKVDAIDSNGAGDTHDGAFIAALLAGATPVDAATIANAAAALSTTRLGPATAPDWTEVSHLLKQTERAVAWPVNHVKSNRGSRDSHDKEEENAATQ